MFKVTHLVDVIFTIERLLTLNVTRFAHLKLLDVLLSDEWIVDFRLLSCFVETELDELLAVVNEL